MLVTGRTTHLSPKYVLWSNTLHTHGLTIILMGWIELEILTRYSSFSQSCDVVTGRVQDKISSSKSKGINTKYLLDQFAVW